MRVIFLAILLSHTYFIAAQNKIKQYEHYSITDRKDVIDFIVFKQNNNTPKPILLFCQGSQPVPLFIKIGADTVGISLSNFDLNYMSKYYNIAVISRPFTPIIADTSEINSSYNYVTDKYSNPYSYDTSYLKNDTKEITTRRANKVWKFLAKQKWVDNSTFIVAGHSQGAREAVEIAYTNKDVTQLGLFGFSPNGRFQEAIKRNRKNAEAGKISWQKADSLDSLQLCFFHRTLVDYDKLEHPYLYSWKSFNESNLSKLQQLKIPIYVAYGSDDIISVDCDFLPFYFAQDGKRNLTVKRYENMEHNFFTVDEHGNTNYNSPHWNEVMKTFIDWTQQKISP